jgi:hypothetical protein
MRRACGLLGRHLTRFKGFLEVEELPWNQPGGLGFLYEDLLWGDFRGLGRGVGPAVICSGFVWLVVFGG